MSTVKRNILMQAAIASVERKTQSAEGAHRPYGRKAEGDPVIEPNTPAGELQKKLSEALSKISDKVKEIGEKALAEAGANSKDLTETKKQVDEMLAKQGEILQQLKDVEQKMVNIGQQQSAPETASEMLRKALTEKMDDIKEFQKQRPFQGRVNIPVARKALTNTGVTGAALNYPGSQVLGLPLMPLLKRLTVRDLMAPGRTESSVIFYPRESGFTNNAAPVSEGSLKPKSEITFEQITAPVRTIAHMMDISLQMLGDVSFIQSYIETRMRYGLALVEEGELLTGSGTGQHLNGIYTLATAYVQPTGVAIGGSAAETDLDKLRFAMLQAELAFATVTGVVLNPVDWVNIETIKDTLGQYIFARPAEVTTPRVWGRDIVSTPSMTQGKFLIGDFAMHTQIFDREDANVAISFENKDNFERNMATIRVEERLVDAIYRPEALIKGTLESAS